MVEGGAAKITAPPEPDHPPWTYLAISLLILLVIWGGTWELQAALSWKLDLNTLLTICALEAGVWSACVFILRPGPIHTPRVSGCKSLSREIIQDYYNQEKPLWHPGGSRASQTLVLDRSARLPNPDVVDFTDSHFKYALDPQLEQLQPIISNYYRSTRKEYKPNDAIAVVTGVTPGDDRIEIGIAKGRLVDEYVTSQNPEMDYSNCTWPQSTTVAARSVRQFFAHGDGPGGNDGRLPEYPTSQAAESRPAVRLSAHLVLLLPAPPGTPWEKRRFLLQDRAKRVATGEQGITSSTGSGMDYADAFSRRAARYQRDNGHGRFTNYVLRELRYEVQILEEELEKLVLVAITRDLERLGQPVAILLGEVKPAVTAAELQRRWVRAKNWGGRFFRLKNAIVRRQAGREYWEAHNLITHHSIRDIPVLLEDPRLEGGTKACLFYLEQIGADRWNGVPPWVPSLNRGKAA